MKKKIGEIYNKPIVVGDKNLVKNNEIHISQLTIVKEEGESNRSITIRTVNEWTDQLIEESTIEVPANATKWSDFVTQTSPLGVGFYYIYSTNDLVYYVHFQDKYGWSSLLETDNGGNVKIDDTIDFNTIYMIKVDG
jgi:hypothetical protein